MQILARKKLIWSTTHVGFKFYGILGKQIYGQWTHQWVSMATERGRSLVQAKEFGPPTLLCMTCPNLTVHTQHQEVSLIANERLWVAMMRQHKFLGVMKVNFDGDTDSERWQGSPEVGQENQAINPGISQNFSIKITSTKQNSKLLQTLKEDLSSCSLRLPVWKDANLHCYVRGRLYWLNFTLNTTNTVCSTDWAQKYHGLLLKEICC